MGRMPSNLSGVVVAVIALCLTALAATCQAGPSSVNNTFCHYTSELDEVTLAISFGSEHTADPVPSDFWTPDGWEGPGCGVCEIDDFEGGSAGRPPRVRSVQETPPSQPARQTSYEYESDGRIRRVAEPTGRITEFEYNPDGTVGRATVKQGSVTEYEYTAEGKILPNGERRYASKTSENKTTGETARTEYEYDSAGRIIRTRVQAAPAPSPAYQLEYEYDEKGNLTKVRDGKDLDGDGQLDETHRELEYEYDPTGQWIHKVVDQNTGQTYLEYEYDEQGGITRATVAPKSGAAAKTVEYEYDPLGRRIETIAKQGATQVQVTTYSPEGFPNNLVGWNMSGDVRDATLGQTALDPGAASLAAVDRVALFVEHGGETQAMVSPGDLTLISRDEGLELTRAVLGPDGFDLTMTLYLEDPVSGDLLAALVIDEAGLTQSVCLDEALWYITDAAIAYDVERAAAEMCLAGGLVGPLDHLALTVPGDPYSGLFVTPDGQCSSCFYDAFGRPTAILRTNPVPEPATLGLLAAGLAALIGRRHRATAVAE